MPSLIRDLLSLCLPIIILASSAVATPIPWEHPANAGLKARLARAKCWVPPNPGVRLVPAMPVAPAKRPMGVPCRGIPFPGRSSVRVPVPFSVIRQEAYRIGIDPVVVVAIQVHESANYRSKLWNEGFNPGGIEFSNRFSVPCWRNPRRRRFAAFRSALDGIKAHIQVLAHRRYDRARKTTDAYQQVDALYRGGYCEPGYSWSPQVKAHVRRLRARGMDFAVI